MARPSQKQDIVKHAFDMVKAGEEFSLDRLAEHSGFTKGGILYHFSGVQAVLNEVVTHYAQLHREYYESLQAAMRFADTPFKRAILGIMLKG